MNINQIVVGFAATVGAKLLKLIAQVAWDSMWESIFETVAMAENTYRDRFAGDRKKKWVMDRVVEYLEEKKMVKWWNRAFIIKALDQIIDRVIEDLNEVFARSWRDRAEDVKEAWGNKIKILR